MRSKDVSFRESWKFPSSMRTANEEGKSSENEKPSECQALCNV
jgi:hypothetical protein